MQKVKKDLIETILSAVVGSLGCWLIMLAMSRICRVYDLPMFMQGVLVLGLWPFASYKLIVAAPKVISWLLNNRRAAPGGEPPQRYDYRRELNPEITERGGKCRGFMRLVILEKGAWADGEYDKADLIYGIARVMMENPHFAGQKDVLQTIISSAAKNCPCDHCKAERAVKEREATNN